MLLKRKQNTDTFLNSLKRETEPKRSNNSVVMEYEQVLHIALTRFCKTSTMSH